MAEIFSGYLKIGFWTAFVIGGALLLLPRLSRRYTAKLPYAVWLVLTLRLLCPVGLSIPEDAVPVQLETLDTGALWTAGFGTAEPLTQEIHTTQAILPTENEIPSKKTGGLSLPAPLDILTAVWAVGAGFLVARFAWRSFRLAHMLKRWGTQPSAQTQNFYGALGGEKRPPLLVCHAIESPMAAGLFSPKIYIPHEEYNETELEMILRHEWIHCRRRDIWYKLLLFAAECLHWYNPLVHLLARQAHKDLEISCDAEAVRGQDAAYRKAYGLMILRETGRGLELRQGLNTCFADGKKTLKERLCEILDSGTRRKGLPLLALALLLAAGAGCAIKEAAEPVLIGGAEQIALPLNEEEIKTLKGMAADWAEALANREGEIRYNMMSENMKEQFVAERIAIDGEDWSFHNIRGSSPWVNDYEITLTGDKATIVYDMQDSIPQHYEMIEILKFGEIDGEFVVTFDTCSSLRQDGKPYNNVTFVSTGVFDEELDNGVFDFMRESITAVLKQLQLDHKEIENISFWILDVQKKALSNGNDEIMVDFELGADYRNAFRDPDDIQYIFEKKETNPEEYEKLYREYYALQEYKEAYRFICQTAPGAEDVTEDTCYPETFRLYRKDIDSDSEPYDFDDKNAAAELLWDNLKLGNISKMPEGNDVLVEPQIWVEDTTGRTNNGYFVLNIGNAEGFTVADDAVILLRDADGQKQVSCEEWMEMLKFAGSNAYKSYSVELGWKDDEAFVAKVTEVYRKQPPSKHAYRVNADGSLTETDFSYSELISSLNYLQ